MEEIKLKPCPFCGEEAHLDRHDIFCDCGAKIKIPTYVGGKVSVGGFPTYEQARQEMIETWNNRADVVPRSEYEAVVSAVDNSTKEFLKLHDAYQNQKREYEAELNKAKQESTDFYCSFTQSKIQSCPIQDEIAKAKQEVAREILSELRGIEELAKVVPAFADTI